MIEKLKEKINKNKKDKNTFNEYIKSFCESEKIQDYYKENSEFNNLKRKYLIDKKEDEY